MAFSKRVTLRQALSMGGAGLEWSPVVLPDLAFNYLPFAIQQAGRLFRPDPVFDLRSYAGIAVAQTYWLDTVNGNDGWPGTEAQPLKTWNAVIGKGDYDRIIIKDGSYLIRSESSLVPSRSVEIIGQGTVYFTSDRGNNLGAWSLAAGQTYTYQASTGGEYIARIEDYHALDGFGHPRLYASKASIAEVEATHESFYWAAGGTLYVHPLNDMDPTGHDEIKYLDSVALNLVRDNFTIYIENVKFRGGVLFNNSTAAGGLKVYLKGCEGNIGVKGVDEIIVQSQRGFIGFGDGANYDLRNGVATRAVEINCEFFNTGENATHQASTIHNDTLIVRIGGKYHHTRGQNIADIGTGKTWMLGSELYDSVSGVGGYFGNEAWLDSCRIRNNATDLIVESVGVVHTRDLISGGNHDVDAGGVLDTY